jgi:branched-chain amino acid transport system ATP-binding protein
MPLGIEWSGLSAGYGPMKVLFDVDIKVPAGTVLALLGPNGAGKTTSLRVASGMLSPSRGSVRLLGEDVTKLSIGRRSRKGLCLVPEGRGIFPSLSVAENLILHTHLRGRSAQAEIEARAFDRFPKLAERRHQIAGTLSGGEQQMLALSRALTTDPKVLLLDEISMGLAPIVVEHLFELVRDLAKEGLTIVIVEQLVQDALEIADYVVLLNQGRTVAIGQPADVHDDILNSYLGHGAAIGDEVAVPNPGLSADHDGPVRTPNGTLAHRRSCPIALHQKSLLPLARDHSSDNCKICEPSALVAAS